MDDGKVILRNYMRSRKIGKGISTFSDAQKEAEKLGKLVADALGNDFSDVTEDELALAIKAVLTRAYSDSAAGAAVAQRIQNSKLKLGIGSLQAEFDPAEADKIAQELAGKLVSGDFVAHLVQKVTVGAVDETIRKNAEARQDMGLEVHISRTYSDVGLRSGTKYAEECQWCLERCGEWDNYQDAYNAGAFERHPGCLCYIDYHVGKTHTVSDGGNWIDV